MIQEAKENFAELLEIMQKLRKECPWDRKQTHQTLRQYLIEECYEVIESIDEENHKELSRELGDLLLQIIFHSEIASEQNKFDINSVIINISRKLKERHPHIFGDAKANSPEEVEQNWEHIKFSKEKRTSILEGIPQPAPALIYAQRMQEKASRVGFDWKDPNDVLKKIEEELQEVKNAVRQNDPDQIEAEIGDLLFSVVNFSRFMDIVSEDALRLTNKKFKKRFQFIESQFGGDPEKMCDAGLEELDKLWEKAKEDIQ